MTTSYKIDPRQIKSMVNEFPISVASDPYGSYSLTIKNDVLYLRTANRLEAFPLADEEIIEGILKYGIPTSWEESGPRFRGFKAAGEKVPPYLFDIIPKMPNIASISGVPLHMYLPVKTDTPVELYTSLDVYIGDPNKRGFFSSLEKNFEHNLRRNLLLDDTNHFHYDIVKWAEFLEKEGYAFEKSGRKGVIGLGIMDFSEGGVAAAYLPEKGYMVTPLNFYEIARNVIFRYGLTDRESIEAMKRAFYLHEIGHVVGIKGDRKNEKLLGELQEKFYSMLAEEFKGTNFERIYGALAEFGSDYAKSYSLSDVIMREIISDLYPKKQNLEYRLFETFWKEATEKGLEGKEKIDYIKKRRKETLGQLEDESSLPEQESLEQKVENSARLSSIADERGNIFTIYDGVIVGGDGANMPKEFILGKGKTYEPNSSKSNEKDEETYETRISKSGYKSMKDVTESEANSKKAESDRDTNNPKKSSDSQQPTEGEAQEAEEAEVPAEAA